MNSVGEVVEEVVDQITEDNGENEVDAEVVI